MRRPLERILSIGITGSGKSYQWLKIAQRLKSVGAKFRVADTDNDIDFMLHTQFPELLPENGGNVYVCPAYDWPEYEKAVKWIQQRNLAPEQLNSLDKHLQLAYKTPIRPIDWVVVDKSNNAWSTVQSYFVGEVFGENTGEYFLQVRKRLWAAGDIGKSGKKAVSTILEGLDGWKDWCCDSLTQILTVDGWKSYNEVKVGERVLVLDQHSWQSRWESIIDVHIGPPGLRKMVRRESNSHDSLTTPEHRWLVESHIRGSRYSRRWRTSETLKTQDRIPMCASPERLPRIRSYSDSLVEVVAWYITEGSRTSRRYPQGTISQSTKHEGNVARIRKVLNEEFGDIHERLRSWGVIMFDLPYRVMLVLDEIAPNKCPSFEFLLKLTREQLHLFVEVCMLGDGSIRGTGQGTFVQNRKDVVEAFEFACVLQGVATRTWLRHNDNRFGSSDYYQVSILKRQNAIPVRGAHRLELPEKLVDYEDIVWCPVTPSGTWLAKRRGTVYFTGNSVINKLYDDWINPIVYRVKCHVYAAADVDTLDKTEKDPEILSMFGDLRIKPSGQKKIGGQMHTIFLMVPGTNRWAITTVKDRSGRSYFTKTPLTDMYMQYLFARAGWPMIESED